MHGIAIPYGNSRFMEIRLDMSELSNFVHGFLDLNQAAQPRDPPRRKNGRSWRKI